MNLLLFVFFVAAAQAVPLAPLLKVKDPVPNRFVVKFKDGVDVDSFTSVISKSVTVKRKYDHVFHGVAIEAVKAKVKSVAALDFVEYIEEDAIMKANCEWNVDRINQRNLPLDGNCNFYHTGSGANVFVVDTGIRYTHVEFSGRASFFYDFESGGDGSDCHGHGTHCAGTAVGNTVGVAVQANVYSVRVLDCQGSGLTSNIVAGLDAIAASGPKPGVVSMSLGDGASTTLDNGVKNVINAGYPTSVSAGSSNINACNQSPARVAEALTVGATTSSDEIASFSNFGTCVDIFAPGVSIRSAWHTSDTAYETMSSTSTACPLVAGCVALHLASGQCSTGANCKSKITGDATSGVIINPGIGSPNLLLYCSP